MEFHQCHASYTPFDLFFITISKITKEIFAKICWQLKTPTRTWKCTRCIMQMSYVYASDFSFKNFCKIAQHTETIRKNVWEKSNDAYSLSIRVQATINHISILKFFMFFYDNINVKENDFFSERELKKVLRDTWTPVALLGRSNFWLVRSEHAHASYPGLLFRPSGFSPYMGREERRLDYTKPSVYTSSICLLENGRIAPDTRASLNEFFYDSYN